MKMKMKLQQSMKKKKTGNLKLIYLHPLCFLEEFL